MQRILKFLQANKFTLTGLSLVFAVWFIIYIKNLSVPIIQQWDEARNAVNMQEMLQNKNWLMRYFQGSPDTWELKPPMLIWFQCMSTKLFGVTEFGIRFPSAMAALGIAFITFFLLLSENVKHITATLSAITVITMPAALHPHGFLFGDHDALLCFFQAVMLTAQYRYFKSGKSKWIWLTAGAFLMGWLTKSIAICFVLPGIWMLGALIPDYRKRIFSIHQTLAFSSAIGVIFIYYMLRNHYQPGYIDMVNQEEWLGRFGKHPQANHDLFYYLKGFYHDRLKGFVFPVLLSMLWAIGSRQKSNFQKLGFMVIIFTLPILSLSQSKNYWYDLPLLFPMALCMALLFDYILSFTKKYLPKTEFFIGMVALFFITKNAWEISQSHNHFGNPNKKEILVQHLKQDRFDKTIKYGVFCNAFNTDILFYLNNLKRQGYSFTIVETSADLRKYNRVMMAKEDEEAWKKQRSGSIGEPDLEIFSH